MYLIQTWGERRNCALGYGSYQLDMATEYLKRSQSELTVL